jgi:UDP-GlcNAc:undecaprenyl-phosphate/decaprenyl-phosphate GlcNAc-1-phosphate transferase
VSVLAGLAAGVAAGALGWRALRDLLAAPLFARENHRGRTLPTGGGLVVVAAVLAVEAGWAVLEAAGGPASQPGARRLVLLAVVGFALLGLVDDLAGSGADGRGFRGHLRAATRGRLTTGGLKLLGGGALAVVVCAPRSGDVLWRLLADALVVALAANLGNLFDRAPGRTTKVAVLALAAVVAATGAAGALAGVAVAVGAATALLAADLGERVMLGDTGANAVGAALGLGVVLTASPAARLAVLAGLVALNAASELVSFSRVIGATPPLRWLDGLGRQP